MRGVTPRGKRRTAPIAAVVTAPRVPRLGLWQRQLQTAWAAWLLGLGSTAFPAPEVVAVVIVVVAQAEEPHEPHDEGSDVEDSEAHHEDPTLHGHSAKA